MYLKERVGIKGRVILQKRRIDTARLKYLEKIDKQERETRTRIMTDEDRRIWDKAIVQEYRKSNLTMTRAIDQITSLFGRAIGYGLNTWDDDDRNSIGNNLGNTGVIYGGLPASTENERVPALFPEIIGIGRGITDPVITDASLDDPFIDAYRNTYNDKFGGYIKPGYTFKDDFICQYAHIYTTEDINDLDFPIYEVGLFSPEIHVGSFPIYNNQEILFRENVAFFETNNRIWSALNVSTIHQVALNDFINAYYREFNVNLGFNVDRISQQVNLGNAFTDANARALVAFTPRYDSLASVAPRWGTERGFNVGNLLARIVIPVGFVKNYNESLTVIWQIYFSRLS